MERANRPLQPGNGGPGSIRTGLLMFLFFLGMSVFWTLKPVRKGLFIGHFKDNPIELFGTVLGGAKLEQAAKLSIVLLALIVGLAVPYLTKRFALREIIAAVCGLSAAGLLISSGMADAPGGAFVWLFYVLGDFVNSFVITLLWMLLHNSLSPSRARSTYGAIGIGTVSGGLAGSLFIYLGIESLGRGNVIALAALPAAAIGLIGYSIACRISDRPESVGNCFASSSSRKPDDESGDASALGFWRKTIGRSVVPRYWLGIALLVALYEISSGIIDFQLSVAVEGIAAQGVERESYFGLIGQVQSLVALIVQVFVTGWVLKRWGVGIALMILPFATLFGSVGFLLLPTLTSAMFLSISDNALNYSVNQSAKETLYVPAETEERIAAKSIIDIFVQRVAKAAAMVLNLLLVSRLGPESVRWLTVLAIVLIVLWIAVARYTGRKFNLLSLGNTEAT